MLLSSSSSSPGEAALLPVKSLTKLEREVRANSQSFNLGKTELMLKEECAGTWGNRDFFSQWVFACLSTKHRQYRTLFITLCPTWVMCGKIGIAFSISRAAYFLFLSVSLRLASCQGRHYQVWLDMPSWDRALPRTASTLTQLTSTLMEHSSWTVWNLPLISSSSPGQKRSTGTWAGSPQV